ncbi:MAG: hypothetical protein IJE04_05795 [Bacilli bacterium]|nr:hypothetical protein [Bacilli bacterium]
MILLILSLLNWIFLKNSILKILVALIIFIIAEVKRKNGDATKSIIVAEFISALILVANLLILIIGLFYRFMR